MFSTHCHTCSAAAALVSLLVSSGARADELESSQPAAAERSSTISAPSIGVLTEWTDEFIFHDWRIQRNTDSQRYRLVDDRNLRVISGTFDECREHFELLRLERAIPPLPRTVVLVLHGMGRYRGSMETLADGITRETNLETLLFGYSSLNEGLEDHARSFGKVIKHLEGVERIHLVAHSLGNLVVRAYYARSLAEPAGADRRIERLVMLGPPNHRPRMAVGFASHPWTETVYRKLLGPSGEQLSSAFVDFEDRLTTPTCQFAIVAGGAGTSVGYNPLLEGDDDGLLTIPETRIAGARDFMVLPLSHQGLMTEEVVSHVVGKFLTTGALRGFEAPRYPIFDDDEPAPRDAFEIDEVEPEVAAGE